MKSHSDSDRSVFINGFNFHYEVRGEGEPLLLVHGFTGTASTWSIFGEEWTQGYQLIIPDLRGHGHSTNPLKEYKHKQVAEDLVALLDHLKIESVRGVGVSGGGIALLLMARFHPERLKSMVLVSATSHFPEQARALMRLTSFEGIPPSQLEELRKLHPRGDAQIRELYEQANGFSNSYDDINLTPADLSLITASTLIVQGDRDPLYPLEISVEMFRSIPGSSLWIVPDGGHGPVLDDVKPEFLRVARKYLADH